MSLVCKAFRNGGGAGGLSAAGSGPGGGRGVELGGEGREPLSVGGELVEILARDAGDEVVTGEPGQVVAGLVPGVGGAAEQSGHQGAQALVGDAGDGEHAGA